MKNLNKNIKNLNESIKYLNENMGYIRFYVIVFIIGFALIVHSEFDLLSFAFYGGILLLVIGAYKLRRVLIKS